MEMEYVYMFTPQTHYIWQKHAKSLRLYANNVQMLERYFILPSSPCSIACCLKFWYFNHLYSKLNVWFFNTPPSHYLISVHTTTNIHQSYISEGW